MLTLFINVLLILALSSLASFLGLRVWINRLLRPNPEDLPELTISKESPLYKNFYDLLDQAPSDKHSLFYPLSPLQDALLERIKLADQAVGTIEAQYYMLNDDEAGDIFLSALIDAAKRGVQIRLLIDDLDVIQREDVMIRLVDEYPNFQIRVFNAAWLRLIRKPEFLVRFPRLSRRMHNKSYTIDGIFSIIGGRNIGNEYFDLKHELTFADFDILFAGPMVQEIRVEFDTYWHSGLCTDIHRLGTAADDAKYAEWRQKLSKTYAHYLPILMKDRDQVLPALKRGEIQPYYAEVRVIYDHPDKILTSVFKPDSRMLKEVEGVISSAQQELLICAAYFIPSKHGMQVLKGLRERGVKITVLTNSFESNDVMPVHASYSSYRKQLLQIGVRLYELKSHDRHADNEHSLLGSECTSLHAKALFIDRRKNFIGSFNMDPRSAIHNTEMGAIFEHAGYAEMVTQEIYDFVDSQAYKIQLSSRGKLEWHEPLADGTYRIHTLEPKMTPRQRRLLPLIAALPIEWLL